MRVKIVLFCLVLGIVSFSYANLNSSLFVDANDELINIPRSVALAGADLAIGNGISPESSPANLAFDSLHRMSISYANYFQNTYSTSIISFNAPVGTGIGLGVTTGYVYIPDIDISPDSSIPTITDKKNCSYIYLRMGIAKQVTLKENIVLSLGGALQAKRTNLIEYRGYNIGLDGGARISFLRSGFSAGVLLENITSITQWSNDYSEIALPHLCVGFGYEHDISYIYGHIKIAYSTPDLLSNTGYNTDLSDKGEQKVYKNPLLLFTDAKIGAEYTILRRVSLRVGLTQGKFSFGGGLQLFNERAGVDFAYITHALSGTYQLSLTYQW